MSEWLQNLKPGDQVVVNGTASRINTVSKVTATQIIIHHKNNYTLRFSKETGYLRGGGSYCTTKLEPATPELLEKIELQELQWKARLILDKLERPKNVEGMKAFIAALEPFTKKPEGE